MNKHIPFLLLITALFFACGNDNMSKYGPQAESSVEYADADYGDDIEMEAPRTAEAPPPPPPSPGRESTPNITQQKIVYTAQARARVENLDSSLTQLAGMVTRSGGFISSQHRNNSTYEHSAELVIRLPSERLNGVLDFLARITAEIDHQHLDSRNVTAEWLDLESRLNTKREVRDRYIDILRNRAKEVKDILNAEDKIRVITEEIEAKEGRLRYLRDQVSLSTLTLNLYETIEYRETGVTVTRSFWSKLVGSLAFGWEMIQELLLGMVAIWPLLLLAGIGIWVFRRWRAARRNG